MKRDCRAVLVPILALLAAPALPAWADPCVDLKPHLETAGKDADFQAYLRGVAASARKAGVGELASRVEALGAKGKPVPADSAGIASCLLRRYVVSRYGERMVRDLQEMVRFRTFEVQGQENWNAPEFLRQREWLERRARELGLSFKSYDGRVEEIDLPGPSPILALLTHGDVQDVQGQQWSSPPGEAKIVNGRMIGRGTEDDKGPIVAALYVMAALRDSGWPLGSTIRLLIANGEETSWEEIPYYLARAPMPERTIGLDAAYPVTHAQKGYGVLTFRAEPVAEPRPGKWRIARMSGGSGLSIIAERGEALLEPDGEQVSKDAALAELSRQAAEWAQAHPPAKLTVSREGDLFKVTAEGRGGHSSEPASGHNALGDLTAFLAILEPRMDPWGALAAFVGFTIGTETDGRSLGIQHVDPAMGALTCNLSFLREENGVPVAQINIRPPRGITKEEIEKSLATRTAAFLRRTRATITAETDLPTEAHYVPPEGELVSSLLAAWEEVTGAPGRPVAIGGATQARFFKGGVDFGPAPPGENYRAHGPDEYLTIEELHRIAELTITAVWKLARSTS
jgi:predicted dipeptidase